MIISWDRGTSRCSAPTDYIKHAFILKFNNLDAAQSPVSPVPFPVTVFQVKLPPSPFAQVSFMRRHQGGLSRATICLFSILFFSWVEQVTCRSGAVFGCHTSQSAGSRERGGATFPATSFGPNNCCAVVLFIPPSNRCGGRG